MINSLPLSSDNFIIAWQLICERYNNKKLLIDSHIKAIFDLPKIGNENLSQLRHLTDEIWSNLRSLNNLGKPTEQ